MPSDAMLEAFEKELSRLSFGNGIRLPHGVHPRIRRNRGGPLPNPRDWDETRVLRHFRWAWLAKHEC